MQGKVRNFFSDKNGRIVLWQSPNLLLYGWIVFTVAAKLMNSGYIKTGLEQLSTAVLFSWACYEAANGVSYFRKTLGILILAIIISGFFR